MKMSSKWQKKCHNITFMSGREPSGSGKGKKPAAEKDIEALKNGKVGCDFETVVDLYVPLSIPVNIVTPFNRIALITAREITNLRTVGRWEAIRSADDALSEILRDFDGSMEAYVTARNRRHRVHARGTAV